MLLIHQHQCTLDLGGKKKRALKQGKTTLTVKDNLIMQQWSQKQMPLLKPQRKPAVSADLGDLEIPSDLSKTIRI